MNIVIYGRGKIGKVELRNIVKISYAVMDRRGGGYTFFTDKNGKRFQYTTDNLLAFEVVLEQKES